MTSPPEAPTPKKAASPHAGHRARLREKLLQRGAESFADYEILELILTIAIPRRDVKPLAKALMAEFGSLADVINADLARLESVTGLGETTIAVLKVMQAATIRVTRDQVADRPILSGWGALIDYLKASNAYRDREVFRVLFLDQKNVLIADEVISEGTINHAPVYPREIMARALNVGAVSIILCHNHPSGDPTPSRQDISITRDIAEIGGKLGVKVHDHVIIGKKGEKSLKSMGLID
ncbi:MAG: DNA repair protein RadC [Pseudomonadota bacterium]